MENRKPYVLTVAIAIAVSVFFAAQPAAAYEVNTHAYLTSEAIELYNKNTEDNKITDLKRFIIDGAKHEDDLPRPQNHFYDPINDEGLNDSGFNGQSAKEWANDASTQGETKYKLANTSSLPADYKKKIDAYGDVTNFTWNAAIRYWLKGDKEMAMEVLGHVLHLIEDMGVPEHTRNDSHSRGSKYEEYAKQYDSDTPDENLRDRLGDKKPASLKSLDKYFDGLAKYSNKYFYSPGSLGEYDFPELDYKNAESRDRVYYISAKDDEGVKYYLAIKKNIANIALGYIDVSVVDEPIKESYWNLLSVRTVRYSAGVIDLFFRDVEKARNNPDFLKEETPKLSVVQRATNIVGSIWTGTKDIAVKTGSFFSNVFKAIGDGVVSSAKFVGGLFSSGNGLSDVGNVDSESSDLNTGGSDQTDKSSIPSTAAVKKDAIAKKNAEIESLKLQIAGLQKDAQEQDKVVLQLEKKQAEVVAGEIDATSTKPVKIVAEKQAVALLCPYSSNNRTGQKSVIINEVAWMGGVRSASDEWIELKNVSGSDVDVSDWQLLNKGGGIKVRLGDLKNPIIKPGQFILLERTDNNSAVGATASLIYSGALGNTNDGLKLFNASCGIVDEVTVSAHWPAGSNDSKQTMERNMTASGWHTSLLAGGTPIKENSAGVTYSSGGGSVAVSANGQSNTNQGGAPKVYPTILISKVQLPSATGVHDGSVALYNPNGTAIDLTGWYVQKKTKSTTDFSTFAKADLFAGRTIAAYGSLTIAHPSSTAAHDIVTDYGIAGDSTLVIKNPNREIVDKVGWGETSDCEGSCAAQPADGRSISRKTVGGAVVDTNDNASDFVLSALQTSDALTEHATTTEQSDNSGAAPEVTSTSSTSTILWDGGAQSGDVHDLFTDHWVGQRIHFSEDVSIGSLKFGYYNDLAQGSVDAAIFDVGGSQRWTTILTVPRISYGGYISHDFPESLHLIAGDYFVGSRLVSGAIGIRKGYGSNPCGVAVYTTGAIPSCDDRNDVSMEIGRFVATSTDSTSTDEIPDQVRDDSDATSTAVTFTGNDVDVVISEIMYDLPGTDSGREWIELYNAGTTTVDIEKLKFYEDDTNHGLTVWQGANTLPAGEYAIIAASSTEFLKDNTSFSGVIFDSSFEMNNEGGPLSLKHGELVINATAYASSTGANGDGMSLQKFNDGWHAAPPTPGMESRLAPVVIEVATTTATTTDLVADMSTTTDVIASSTPAQPIFAQLLSDAKSNPEPVTTYTQILGKVGTGAVRTLKVYVNSDESVQWTGGIGKIIGGNYARSFTNSIAEARVYGVNQENEKTLLVFDFGAPKTLEPEVEYTVYLQPNTMTSLVSSVYGSSGDSYNGGALVTTVRYPGGSSTFGSPGISDMYFEIN